MNIGNRNKKKKGLNLMMKLLMLSLIDPGDKVAFSISVDVSPVQGLVMM